MTNPKTLKFYVRIDGVDEEMEVSSFRYDAKRMGSAPTISFTLMYPKCLDAFWDETVYATFRGEKFFLKQTPTSSYSNEDSRYKHEVELVSERIILDNVYFYDSVAQGETPTDDKPVSNGTKFVFWGDISQFKDRLNASLRYSGLDYEAVVDEGVTSEEKLVSFEDTFFSNAIQESYNTFDIPYYFVGKTIHFGYSDNVIATPFEYGVDNALLSITKTNANYKVVNRVTGTGSSDNIPYYYPNKSPKGNIIAEVSSAYGARVEILDFEKFSNEVGLDETITYSSAKYSNARFYGPTNGYHTPDTYYDFRYNGMWAEQPLNKESVSIYFTVDSIGTIPFKISFIQERFKIEGTETYIAPTIDKQVRITLKAKSNDGFDRYNKTIDTFVVDGDEADIIADIREIGDYLFYVEFCHRLVDYAKTDISYHSKVTYSFSEQQGWILGNKSIELEDVGLSFSAIPMVGDTITQRLEEYIKPSQTLMPSIYRESKGQERFYNATNNTYEGVEFVNPYTEGHPKEHIITVDDLKPTIKEATNEWTETNDNGEQVSIFQRFDMFSEFAYDRPDNDETEENEEGSSVDFKHSYFFGKLRKMDFNLFDHAIENQPMTIEFTSGDCGACKFEIGVTEGYPQYNPVQVNADGTLKRDSQGRVICGVNEDIDEDDIQESQQDTSKGEVWIALKKEEQTYGILMPKAPTDGYDGADGHRPKACTNSESNDGDTFVITGINLPESYILNAEKKLEAEIIKYMQENNEEKFNFTIDFSRIYFEENQELLEDLNENSRIRIIYNGNPYTLYVNSFSYEMSEGDVLPQIRVELDDALTISENALQSAINSVKSEVGRALGSIDFLGITTPYFLRKDVDDEVNGKVNFKKGVKFGEGGKVEILDNNSAKLTIEYLEVTKKASFTSLEIQEKTHAGGQILVTPASINCGEVEEFENYYRCYFQIQGEEGKEIFNQFVVGDQAICQTYNAWGSKYYWRLVVGTGEDYIDLSKVEGEFDEGSDAPSEGDKIIQLGNQVDEARQNAIVIAAYGDGSPYIIQYKGINAFELTDENIITKLSSTENIFTGIVHMEMGSDGLENFDLNLEIGGENLLRNSGFTGDYLSETLADNDVLEATKQLYSDPLDHWTTSGRVGTQDAEGVAVSGKAVVIPNNASISQELYYDIIVGQEYILSFKAKGKRANLNNLRISFGGTSETVMLTEEWQKYTVKFVPISEEKTLLIQRPLGNTSAYICDLKLEKGNIATEWSASSFDNSSDRTYYQSLKYLQDALANGSTTIGGGLVLTKTIVVGNYKDNEMVQETGGISGTWTDDESLFAWAGGTYKEATNAVLENGQKEANFVVTHGGKVILNDAKVRGEIHANKGNFGELKIGKYINACGREEEESSVYAENIYTKGERKYHSVVQLKAGSLVASGSSSTSTNCYFGNIVRIDPDSDSEQNRNKAAIYAEAYDDIAALKTRGTIVSEGGVYKGLRPSVKYVTDDLEFNASEYSVIIANSHNKSITLYTGAGYQDGAYIDVHNIGNGSVLIETGDDIMYKEEISNYYSVGPFESVRLIYSYETNKWYAIPTIQS